MPPESTPPGTFRIGKARTRFFGLTLDEIIKAFFGGNATVAVVVLALITIFLFREGFDFFSQNRHGMRVYRLAGLEYVDYMRQQEQDHTALTRYLSDVRLRTLQHYTTTEGASIAEANARLASFDEFAGRFSDAVDPLRGLVSELTELVTEIKTKYQIIEDMKEKRRQLLAEGKQAEADAVVIAPVDIGRELAPLTAALPAYRETAEVLAGDLRGIIASPPVLPTPALQERMERFSQLTRQYLEGFPQVVMQLESWDHKKPVPAWHAFTGFIFGREWLTASFWQDWYGVLPLFAGSLMVSVIALVIAVPLGVGAAIYINQIATAREQRLIKPAIEFISAIPSVVLGFFGIAVLGQALRALSQVDALSWVPGFPFAERLNALTAGCLLALIAVPTIFTLAEDASTTCPVPSRRPRWPSAPRGCRPSSGSLCPPRCPASFPPCCSGWAA